MSTNQPELNDRASESERNSRRHRLRSVQRRRRENHSQTNIVISADTDQYQTIYCNNAAHIARPYSVIRLMVYTQAAEIRGVAASRHRHTTLR